MELIRFDRLEKVLTDYANAVVEKYKDNLAASDRLASGELIDSITTEIEKSDGGYEVNLSLLKYWDYIENGTGMEHKPDKHSKYKIGWAGYLNILDWIQTKPILPYPDKNGKLPTQRQLAFLIKRAIEGDSPNQASLKNPEGGIVAKPDLENALSETDYWEMKIEEALDDDIMDAIDRIFIW
mgnify:CR=1 FL=1